MILTILATIVVLGVLIFVHELGHFLTAKLVDIEVPRFSIGLGPKLVGFRRGETEYVISWLPLGGYVKMAGMEEMESLEGGRDAPRPEGPASPPTDLGLTSETPRRAGPRDFESKSLAARAFVISAGVIMNFLFAFLVFAFSAFMWGIQRSPEARIAEVVAERLPEGTEALEQLPPGARIAAVGDESVDDFMDLARTLSMVPAGPTVLHIVDRGAIRVDLPASDSARAAMIGALVPHSEPIVSHVSRGSPAAAAGLRAGDRVVSVAGRPVTTWNGLAAAIEERPRDRLSIVVEREGARHELSVVPEPVEVQAEGGGTRTVGRIGVASPLTERPGIVGALKHGVDRTYFISALVVEFLADLFTGGASARDLGGPILVGQLSGQVARLGIEPFLNFMALFSINLAILNLLPIPVLDGGHLMFLGIEAVRGRALSVEQRMRLTQVGVVIVLAIMVWAIANDVLRLFGI